MAAKLIINVHNEERERVNSKVRFIICPYCGRKGLYKIPRSYEHCRCCGLHRILLPSQDF